MISQKNSALLKSNFSVTFFFPSWSKSRLPNKIKELTINVWYESAVIHDTNTTTIAKNINLTKYNRECLLARKNICLHSSLKLYVMFIFCLSEAPLVISWVLFKSCAFPNLTSSSILSVSSPILPTKIHQLFIMPNLPTTIKTFIQ